ncbi:MAG TPA: hypothetical protein VFI96_03995 [Longimicrobiaceae bacterium]|nr:hypothetical protein [Longimicrobiaceae bacterium]
MIDAIRGRSRVLGAAAALMLAFAVTACDEPQEAEVAPPEVAEVDVEPAEVPPHDFEKAFPITDDDVGDIMLVTGTVVGEPGPAGFFVRAEGNRVVFVKSAEPVTLGQSVRAIGPVQAADVTVFEGWEHDFLGDVDPEWEMVQLFYVAANSVTPL